MIHMKAERYSISTLYPGRQDIFYHNYQLMLSRKMNFSDCTRFYKFTLYQQCTYFLPYQQSTIVNLIVGYRNMNTGHLLWFHSSIRQSGYHLIRLLTMVPHLYSPITISSDQVTSLWFHSSIRQSPYHLIRLLTMVPLLYSPITISSDQVTYYGSTPLFANHHIIWSGYLLWFHSSIRQSPYHLIRLLHYGSTPLFANHHIIWSGYLLWFHSSIRQSPYHLIRLLTMVPLLYSPITISSDQVTYYGSTSIRQSWFHSSIRQSPYHLIRLLTMVPLLYSPITISSDQVTYYGSTPLFANHHIIDQVTYYGSTPLFANHHHLSGYLLWFHSSIRQSPYHLTRLLTMVPLLYSPITISSDQVTYYGSTPQFANHHIIWSGYLLWFHSSIRQSPYHLMRSLTRFPLLYSPITISSDPLFANHHIIWIRLLTMVPLLTISSDQVGSTPLFANHHIIWSGYLLWFHSSIRQSPYHLIRLLTMVPLLYSPITISSDQVTYYGSTPLFANHHIIWSGRFHSSIRQSPYHLIRLLTMVPLLYSPITISSDQVTYYGSTPLFANHHIIWSGYLLWFHSSIRQSPYHLIRLLTMVPLLYSPITISSDQVTSLWFHSSIRQSRYHLIRLLTMVPHLYSPITISSDQVTSLWFHSSIRQSPYHLIRLLTMVPLLYSPITISSDQVTYYGSTPLFANHHIIWSGYLLWFHSSIRQSPYHLIRLLTMVPLLYSPITISSDQVTYYGSTPLFANHHIIWSGYLLWFHSSIRQSPYHLIRLLTMVPLLYSPITISSDQVTYYGSTPLFANHHIIWSGYLLWVTHSSIRQSPYHLIRLLTMVPLLNSPITISSDEVTY